MSDPRVTPDPAQITCKDPARILQPIVDLTRGPDGPRDRQLLFGEDVTILDRGAAHCLIRAEKDGYCGTVPTAACGPRVAVSHRVTARATHAYDAPDFKSPERVMLPFGARLGALGETATFVETELGFIPRQHLHRSDSLATDPAAVAEIFLGTPYLWGGNTYLGIDCSGLVQAALLSCGIPCPGDSDQQQDHLGAELDRQAALQRNDLIFWKGHVAMVVDDKTLIHANAGYMATVHEPITAAIARIEVQGDGGPVARKRLP